MHIPFPNLKTRLDILWIILSKARIWPSISAMWLRRFPFEQIKGNFEPFAFLHAIVGDVPLSAPPDFSKKMGLPGSFTPPGFPLYFNAEPSVSLFLAKLAYYKKPAVVVELGSFVGWTSAHLAHALELNKTGHLYFVDVDPDILNFAISNLKRLGLDGVSTGLLGGTLDESVTSKIPPQIDLLFIDSSHLYPETLNEILFYSSRMAPNGCMVLHDSMSYPGVRQSLAEVAGKFRVLTFATERGNGLTVLMSVS